LIHVSTIFIGAAAGAAERQGEDQPGAPGAGVVWQAEARPEHDADLRCPWAKSGIATPYRCHIPVTEAS
jgi:hypothetical protein